MDDQLEYIKTLPGPLQDHDLDPNSSTDTRCVLPDHEDTNPSMSVFRCDETGYIRWKCRGCDRKGTIVDLYVHLHGIDQKEACKRVIKDYGSGDSTPPKPRTRKKRSKKPKSKPVPTSAEVGLPDVIRSGQFKRPQISWNDGEGFKSLLLSDASYIHTETVEYDDEVVAIGVLRWDDVERADGEVESKIIRQVSWSDGEWQLGLCKDRILRPVYNSWEIQNGEPDRVIFVEGEKCMEELQEAYDDCICHADLPWYVIVTTNIGGAKGLKQTDWSLVENLSEDVEVWIIPDNDAPGYMWAHKIGKRIEEGGGTAEMIKLYDRRGDDPGKDIVDWLEEPDHNLSLLESLERTNPVQCGQSGDRPSWMPEDGSSDKRAIAQASRAWLEKKFEEWPNAYLEEVVEEVARMYVDEGEYLLSEAKKVVREQTDLTKQESNRKWEKKVKKAAGALRAKRADEEVEGIVSDGRPSHVKLAKTLRRELKSESGKVSPVYDEGALWMYDADGGWWAKYFEKGAYEGPLARKVHAFDGRPILDPETYEPTQEMKVSANYTKGVLDTICQQSQENEWPHPFFETAEKGVAFSDCFVYADLASGKMKAVDHDPAHAQRVGLDFPFDRDAESPLFDRYLNSVFKGEDDEANKRLLVQQILGAGLFGLATSAVGKRAFMFQGPKGTGKSTLLHLLQALFPSQSVSSVPPQAFGDSGDRSRLQGKRLNIVFETPNDKVLKEDGFKSIIHGEQISINKKYVTRADIKPIALHVFACNELPDCPGTTDAFWDRWHGLTFNRQFRGTGEEIPDLEERIIANELPGVVAHAVRGAESLIESGGYVWPESSSRMLSEWRKDGDMVQRFFDDCTTRHGVDEENKQTWMKASKLWSAWKKYQNEKGHPDVTRKTFKKLASDAGYTRGKSGVDRWNCHLTVGWDQKVNRD